jgi:hypothetical protein
MNKLNVGDYVRFEGRIFKLNEKWIEFFKLIKKDIKTSPNIIDLIEVGDYVNGYMVENIDCGLNGDLIEIATGINYLQSPSLYNEDIKSVVTHEQFEAMQYKVGE